MRECVSVTFEIGGCLSVPLAARCIIGSRVCVATTEPAGMDMRAPAAAAVREPQASVYHTECIQPSGKCQPQELFMSKNVQTFLSCVRLYIYLGT
jgi:hypothetical protein